MTLTRWSPVRDFAAVEVDRLNRMFEAAFNGEPMARGTWVPAVDIHENEKKDVVVTVDMPGINRDDIKVTFENSVLTIEGERRVPDAKADQYHQVERGYGAFRRTFTLPSSVDGGAVSAAYAEGVLTITLPRREDTRPRTIAVNG